MTDVRNKQCAKCPWKKSTNPLDIPNGYSEKKHHALRSTLARPGEINLHVSKAMACHESPIGGEQYCVGWLVHQLGPGNNIGLRLLASDGRFRNLQLDGEQHKTFEDTLPKHKKKSLPKQR